MNVRIIIRISLVIALCGTELWFNGCEKESVILPSPGIVIDSVNATGMSSFEAFLKIDLGEGQQIKGARIIFDDITVLSVPDVEKEIPLTTDRYQQVSVSHTIDPINHDFAVIAFLETEKYQYFSNEMIARSIKNTFRIYMLIDDMYGDVKKGIADCFNKGDGFAIFVEFNNKYKPNSVDVRLNNDISLEHTLDFSDCWGPWNQLKTLGWAYIPENIDPGIYTVDVSIEGHEFVCEEKIKVLDGQWTLMDSTYPGDLRGDYASFLIDNVLYVVGGSYSAIALDYSPVWKYDLPAKQWTHLANFPHPGNPSKSAVYNFSLKYDGKGHIVIRNDNQVELWGYNQQDDTWSKITDYPGSGTAIAFGFIGGSRLFLGGGQKNNVPVYDFWSYDFITATWNQLNDIKPGGYGRSVSSVKYPDRIFSFVTPDEIWEYNFLTDEWNKKSKFNGQDRFSYSVALNGDKLYVLAGQYYDGKVTYGLFDCWEYSIDTDSWEIMAFMPTYFGHGIAFNYEGKIIAGLGYIHHSFFSYKSNVLYQLTF